MTIPVNAKALQTAQPIAALLERIRAALVAVENAGSLTHRRAAAAHMHLEFELAPLLESIDLEAITARIAADAVAEYRRAQREPGRIVLPMTTDQNMAPGLRFQVTSRPQTAPFRPDRLFIASPELWVIHNIAIGNRSQTAQAGSIPGVAFGDPTLRLQFEVALTAMDVVIDAEYIGAQPEGEVFRAAFTGIAEPGHENYPSTWGARRVGDPHVPIFPQNDPDQIIGVATGNVINDGTIEITTGPNSE